MKELTGGGVGKLNWQTAKERSKSGGVPGAAGGRQRKLADTVPRGLRQMIDSGAKHGGKEIVKKLTGGKQNQRKMKA